MTVCKTKPIRALREDSGRTPPPGQGSDGNGSGPGTEREGTGDRPETVADEPGGVLVCRGCRTKITSPSLAMAVDGKHRHVFFNPYGLVFELGCFASARNLVAEGVPVAEFTWFPGYRWQPVTCSGCRAQLGWKYLGADSGFFGLILKNLLDARGTWP
jgi:hypothetical protein